MDEKHLAALLEAAEAERDGPWSVLAEDRKLTLHIGVAGVGLNVSKIVRLRTESGLLFAENDHGELCVVALADVFAGAVEGKRRSSRKAGFV
jgi:hypothetical protein